MTKIRSYVICTCPRSGSTLLCKLLAATGVAGNPQSYFHYPSLADWLTDFNLNPKDYSSERDMLNAILDAARECGTSGTGVFGLRLQRKSSNFFIQQLGKLYHKHSSDSEFFDAAFGDTLFIHLTRTNKLEQAISLVKATQTGLWHIYPDGSELERLSAPQEPVYDREEIAKQFTELTKLENEWEDWFKKEEISPLRISYDDLSADPVAVLAYILDRLGLDQNAAKGISPEVAKLSDETNRNWKECFLAESAV